MKKMRVLCALAAVMLCGAVPVFAQTVETADMAAADTAAVMEQVAPIADFAVVKEVGTDSVTIRPDTAYEGLIQLNIGDAALLLDNQTGAAVLPADLKAGDKIYAYWSPMMTRSIPPQSNLQLLLTNVEDSVPAHLHTVEAVEADVSGDIIVTTNNGGLLLTIPAAMWQGDALQTGDTVIAWYDVVAMSYPGQAVAERVADAADLSDDRPAVMPEAVIEPVVKQAKLIGVARGGEDYPYVMIDTVDGQEVRLNIDIDGVVDDTPIIDAGTGAIKTLADLQVGTDVVACYGPMITMSIPGQSPMQYMLVNVGEDAPVGLFTAEKVEQTANGTRVLTNNGSLYITIPAGAAENGTAIAEGSRFLAWYDMVLESYPGRTTADKVVMVPDEATKYVTVGNKNLNDPVEYVNGVAMVPLRAVAEALGFEVEWNPADMSAALNNGIVQTVVRTGYDSYYKAAAIEGMLGMSAPQSYGAAMYLRNKETAYVPVQLFKLLGADVEQGLVLKITMPEGK